MPRGLTRRKALSQLALFAAGSPLLRAQFLAREGHQRVPALDELTSIFEFEPVARAKITRTAYDFVAGGVQSEYTLRRNREAYNWAALIPRAMRDVSSVDLSTKVLGQELKAPLMVSPTAGHQQLHREGELDTHRGATAAGATMVVSHGSSYPIDQVAAAAEGALWIQLYVHRNPAGARERIDKAVDAGCSAVCLTVDAQYSSLRERLLHNRNLSLSAPGAPGGRRRRRRRRSNLAPNPYRLRSESSDLDWSFLETLRSWCDLPIILKGILRAEDAKLAVENGADAIVVSNHGARYLSYAPATVEVLPEIADAVEGRIPILIDGGIRRGSDILKALALGANAVLVGRPPLWGLGAFGAAGVQRVLEILQAELALAMAHTGRATIAEIDRSLVATDFP